MAHRSLLLAALIALAIPACSDDDDDPSGGAPCDDDPLACGVGSSIEPDPACTATGVLAVNLGNTSESGAFTNLSAPPRIIHGLQGGQHTFLSVRIDNPALTSPGVELTFYVNANGAPIGYRKVGLTTPALWRLDDLGRLVTDDFLLLLESYPASSGDPVAVGYTVNVRDRCGRMGSDFFGYSIAGPDGG